MKIRGSRSKGPFAASFEQGSSPVHSGTFLKCRTAGGILLICLLVYRWLSFYSMFSCLVTLDVLCRVFDVCLRTIKGIDLERDSRSTRFGFEVLPDPYALLGCRDLVRP
jgi:hypothetical protein